ncbi:PSP1 domain-containing protein [Moheibacter sediminis]|uniref:Cell fate regulator YaaT, PSP1 superfamily (Controls sporulation, competence, biofilm development) n=1 Tax=Moheibacter sediminis TaxID=1434700 RepID=A0A1W2C7Y7_9FLAO|nr:regulatory iron-sulfur-containing complex subunit RicT [Moheibacter sediminis]SMC81375.1 Cell fate regulator YaaT, PSP1 superfamily (controls sporulation, competence, biofilm development) [Moheibacter sediminis]
MSCGSCGTSSTGLPKGCNNNGACGVDSGCGKLPVFDWLSNMRLPNGQLAFNCVEVRFKNDRKQYYKNTNQLTLGVGDVVAVEAQSGHDIGVVTLTGELVRIQMKKRRLTEDSEDVRKIYRKANEKDLETWQGVQAKEKETMMKARRIAVNLGLEMKISDVEYQGDGNKVIFYYTAEGRVDFRVLIKEFASSFGVRIEMKQIGYRQEAAKVGGIGSCGRELCCSTWLTDFRSVNTTAARYQQLSINPQKLAGQCGKLKCCLNYELDSYLDALDHFPSMESTFETEKGTAVCVKIDVFKKEMWFTNETRGMNWHKFSVEQVQEFIALSKTGVKLEPLEDLAKELVEVKKEYVDVIEENSLERFEKKNRPRNRNFNKKPNNPNLNPNQKRENSAQKPKNPNQRTNPNANQNPNQKREGKPNEPRNSAPNPNQKKEPRNNDKRKPNQNPNQKRDSKPNEPKNANPNPNANVNPNQQNKTNRPKNNNSKNRNKRGPQNNNEKD